MDDRRLLHPENELSIFSLTCAQWTSAYLRSMKCTTYTFPLGAELLSCARHTWTLFILVYFYIFYIFLYISVSVPGDSQVTSDCPEAIFTVSVVDSTGYSPWSLTHLQQMHENTEYLFSYVHCLQLNSNRIWGKPLSCSFMFGCQMKIRSRCW